jgi:hypothetical protein
MDLEYLYDHIQEELESSKEYIRLAIELKPMTEAWSKKFYSMSMEEHAHATNFYGMFNEYCSKLSGSFVEMPEYIRDMHREMVDKYTACTTTIKAMWEIYKS